MYSDMKRNSKKDPHDIAAILIGPRMREENEGHKKSYRDDSEKEYEQEKEALGQELIEGLKDEDPVRVSEAVIGLTLCAQHYES